MATGTTAIRSPTDDISNHTIVLRQLKEVAEVGQRLRGDPLDSFVKVRELVDAGIARFTNNQIQPAGSTAGSGGTVLTALSVQGTGVTGAPIELVGDSASPGNNKVYGTNGSGTKGWYAASAGGSTTLAGLTDVAIPSPANGQFLSYNSAASKWENTDVILDFLPVSPTAWDDEFNTGSGLDTTGSRFAGANAWSYLSGTSWPVANLTVANSWLRVAGTSGTHAVFCAKQALPASGAWCFVIKAIGVLSNQAYYGPGLAIINNSISSNNLVQMMCYQNTFYQQTNSYNPSTGAFTFVSNGTTISSPSNVWYYLAVYYPGSGSVYTLGYSTFAAQQAISNLPTEYLVTTTGMPTGFTQHSTFTLSGATHVAITTIDNALAAAYIDWFRRTL